MRPLTIRLHKVRDDYWIVHMGIVMQVCGQIHWNVFKYKYFVFGQIHSFVNVFKYK